MHSDGAAFTTQSRSSLRKLRKQQNHNQFHNRVIKSLCYKHDIA